MACPTRRGRPGIKSRRNRARIAEEPRNSPFSGGSLDKLDNLRTLLAGGERLHQAPGEVSVLSGGFDVQSSAKDQLRTIIARIERLEEEKAALSTDLREVYAEAKGNGFDVKALKTCLLYTSPSPRDRS